MAVFRVEKTKDFTVMSNHHLRNVSLSLKAKGLLSLMLSLPDNWDYPNGALAQHIYPLSYGGNWRLPVSERRFRGKADNLTDPFLLPG